MPSNLGSGAVLPVELPGQLADPRIVRRLPLEGRQVEDGGIGLAMPEEEAD